ncbi:MAG: ABC transporter permease [Synergistetes bacterium]|nr:MAG: Inner-membrane translocator [bacterium 42_11]MBC7331628.1 ABC transporter permease [Synergistota bacterium]MDK2870769.1 ral nucleoside transport system permease protein [bacterium]
MLEAIFTAAIRAGTPLLYATLGEIFAERSGVLNLGLEGLMLVGALAGFVGSYVTSSVWFGVLLALLVGGMLAFLYAFLTVTLRVNQVVAGLALTMLGMGLSGYYGQSFIGKTAPQFSPVPVPLLSKIPFVGDVLFYHDPLVYLAYILVPLSWFYIFKTRFGMNLRAVGEDPKAADAVGINVFKTRYIYVTFGGMLTSLGGAYLSLAYTSMWIENMSAGRGWIAVALVIFSAWDPLRALLASYLFGGVASLQLRIQAMGSAISPHLLMMLPYALTIAVLSFISSEGVRRRIGAPVALMKPYSREEREY